MVFNKFDISGRTALVSGGGRGIGFACAEALMESGCDVGIFDLLVPIKDTKELEAKYSVKVRNYIVDVSDQQSLETAFQKFVQDFEGKIDICVPCAGINENIEFLETSYDKFNRLCNVNFRGSYFTAQLAAKQMIKNGTKKGSIVFICSMGSYIAIRSQRSSAYCGTKGAVRSMVAPISAELQKYGIRANSLSPGYVRTEMTAGFPELIEEWKDVCMNKKVANPEDMAGTCVFLASDASSYMSGEDIIVDAGVTKW
ncbi:hypothetical protein PACTADRAFT_34843 [Pachysolen tannophilus NRRL Y-2460]|uniref:Uncharacterized protein n=1 Tax=Pachysolen tannophilus NRRL Y-2460 TaxID=669874 RepID=A0A1E4TQK6_PACTA|nr:hypothetical protein PACTADRAFT_34843 [Pachysolen tannophilus NRRL Y-2460]